LLFAGHFVQINKGPDTCSTVVEIYFEVATVDAIVYKNSRNLQIITINRLKSYKSGAKSANTVIFVYTNKIKI
jgi:hypothetical protein